MVTYVPQVVCAESWWNTYSINCHKYGVAKIYPDWLCAVLGTETTPMQGHQTPLSFNLCVCVVQVCCFQISNSLLSNYL